MAETYVENTTCDYASSLGWKNRKCRWIGRVGAPDRMFFREGMVFWIEFKDADKPLEPHQVREIERMRAQGLEVHVIDNVFEGKKLFDGKEKCRRA